MTPRKNQLVRLVERIKTGDFVVPGDFLAMAEEFMPGDGTYEEGGKVYSACTGVVLLDTRAKRASVFPRTSTPPTLKRGDIVIGRIEDVRGQVAEMYIGMLKGREDRQLPFSNLGVIHVSQARGAYVRDLSKEFKPGDVVRARVLDARISPIKLSTAGDNLGVILALCSKCRMPLDREDSKLKCLSCGSLEVRKIASDYRQGVL